VNGSVPVGWREPTADECSARAQLGPELWAGWYPQMGGYVGKALFWIWPGNPNNECFEVWVWHDGEFPFSDESDPPRSPAHLHHCMAEQFIEVGKFVLETRARPEGPDGD
jgi:hypothetical protein